MEKKVNRALVAKKIYESPLLEVLPVELTAVLMVSGSGSGGPDPGSTPAPRRPHGGDIIP